MGNPLLVFGFYIKLIADITLAAASLLSFLFEFILVSGCRRERFAHLGKIFCLSGRWNMHNRSHSTKLLLSSLALFLTFSQSCSLVLLLSSMHTQIRTHSSGPWSQQATNCCESFTLIETPCYVSNRKNNRFVHCGNFKKSLGVISKNRPNECFDTSAHMQSLSDSTEPG